MRLWILGVVAAAAVLGTVPTATFAASTPTPTPTTPSKAATAVPTATHTVPSPTSVPPSPTVAPATATPVTTATVAKLASPPPTASPGQPSGSVPSAPITPEGQAGAAPSGGAPPQGGERAAPPASNPSLAATPSATIGTPGATVATPGAANVAAAGTGVVRGQAFFDADANGLLGPAESFLANVEIKLTLGTSLSRTATTDSTGGFAFEGLAPGTYHVTMAVPGEYVATTDSSQDVEVVQDTESPEVLFGLISLQAAGLNPDGTPMPDPSADDEQIIALASVTSLPLRFAEGRDLMAQVQRRVLGDGLVWLGVPFRSQIDGGNFQYVNCGPASLTMILAGFGLEVGPSQVRDYLNNLIDNFNTDLGTSMDVLARIGQEAGLTPMDLYSDSGGYRNWSTDAVRWHIQQGHPVITLVKYRNLPGHTSSLSEFDHYIVISGLTPNGFIYNDAAFASTLGYGLEISDVELEYAWDNSSIPHHALGMGLSPDKKALSFPELPRTPRPAGDTAPARGARRLAQADELPRAPLTLAPVLPTVVAPTGPLIVADQWASDPSFDLQPWPDPGAPMGLNLETTDQPTLEPRPGPGSMVPKLLALVGVGWLLWLVWSTSGRLVRWQHAIQLRWLPRLVVRLPARPTLHLRRPTRVPTG